MITKAAVLWRQPGPWTVQDVELDEPGPTEVLVEMAAAGLCHSDDHYTSGDITISLPLNGGHEGSGVVRRVGSQVTRFREGDHVITSFIPSCGHCRWCAAGMQQLCDMGATIFEGTQPGGGFRMHASGTDIRTGGALGTFAAWQVYDQVSLVTIDRSIPLDVACLVSCGVATGFGSAVNAAEVHPGDVVLLIGAGGVGMNAVQGASLSGARHVVVVDPAPFKLKEAPRFGATETFGVLEEAAEFVRGVTNGQGADAAIVTVGVLDGDIIAEAFEAVRKGGVVVVNSVAPDNAVGIPLKVQSLTYYQKRIQGSLYGMSSPRVAMLNLLELYRGGRLLLDELITARYRLDEINQGYADMHAGRNLRGIIDFHL